jgi:opacity protein-like surface antigen
MKNAMFAAAVLSAGLVAIAGSASADMLSRDGLYATVKGGVTQPQDQSFGVEYDTGFTAGAALGKKFGNYRAEIEGIYEESDTDGGAGKTEFSGAMVNGYYDFKNSSFFTPYVGVGAGYGHLRYHSDVAGVNSVSEDTLAYQGIAGVGYELNPCWTLTGEYRYVGTTEAADTRYQSHSAIAGLRYSF